MNQAAAYDPRERADELLISRALGTLDREERIELDALLQIDPSLDDDRFELVAASLDLALDGDEMPMPDSLRHKVQSDADVFFGVHQRASIRPLPVRRAAGPRPRQATAWQGLATAAVLLLLVWVGWSLRPGGEATVAQDPSPAEIYAEAASDPQKFQWDWVGLEDPTVGQVSGDVVWSSNIQQGAMKIGGLAANDPSEFQYQLWIFDKDRPEATPVDGGVFDVPPGSDEVIVPIDAKLPVDTPYLFAVTVERPGGVVVSDRSRIAILAQPPDKG